MELRCARLAESPATWPLRLLCLLACPGETDIVPTLHQEDRQTYPCQNRCTAGSDRRNGE